jgi:hypothetical protein
MAGVDHVAPEDRLLHLGWHAFPRALDFSDGDDDCDLAGMFGLRPNIRRDQQETREKNRQWRPKPLPSDHVSSSPLEITWINRSSALGPYALRSARPAWFSPIPGCARRV